MNIWCLNCNTIQNGNLSWFSNSSAEKIFYRRCTNQLQKIVTFWFRYFILAWTYYETTWLHNVRLNHHIIFLVKWPGLCIPLKCNQSSEQFRLQQQQLKQLGKKMSFQNNRQRNMLLFIFKQRLEVQLPQPHMI